MTENDDNNDERRQAELAFVEAAYDAEEAWCTRVPPVVFRRIFHWTLHISLPSGYPDSQLPEIGILDDDTNGDVQYPDDPSRLLGVCRQGAAALPGEEAVFAVLNAADKWMQQHEIEDEEDMENVWTNDEEHRSSPSSSALLRKMPHQQSVPTWPHKGTLGRDFYRLTRKPHALTALVAQMTPGEQVVWGADDRSVFLKGTTDVYEKCVLLSWFSPHYRFHIMWMDEQNTTCCLEKADIEIWGICDEDLADTVSWLLSLPDEHPHILSISTGESLCPYTWSRLFLALLSHNPHRQVRFGGIDFSSQDCALLATQEHPIDIVLNYCTMEDGNTFLDCLQQRTTPFGSLTIESILPFHDDDALFASLLETACISKLTLANLVLDAHQKWLLLESHIRHVQLWKCAVDEDDEDDDDVPIMIRPAAFVLGLDPAARNHVDEHYYYQCLKASPSSGLRKLGIQFENRPAVEQVHALMRAVENNNQLKVLELGTDIVSSKDYWHDLMVVIRKSPTVCTMRLHTGTSRPDEEMVDCLNELLNDMRHLNVVFPKHDGRMVGMNTYAVEWESAVSRSLAFNRWYWGVMKLHTMESFVKRDALLGRALQLHSTDPRSVAFLLSNHPHVLVSFLLEN